MLRFFVLGSLAVHRDGRAIELGPPRARQTLATLLMNPGRTVSVDRLVDVLWAEEPPARARAAIQVYISQVRRALGADPREYVVTTGSGYRLDVDPEAVDVGRFRSLVRLARRSDDLHRVAGDLRTALALWRDQPLVGMAEHVREALCEGLESERLDALERRVESDLAVGGHEELLAELFTLVRENPLRERLRKALMCCLYLSGRKPEALEFFRETRRHFIDELGVEPGAELRNLHAAILRDDLGDFYAAPAAPAGPRPTPAQLPAPPPSFAGRAAELTRILHAGHGRTEAPRIVSIEGMPGSGKSAVALYAAHQLADDYPDGQLYLDLRGTGETPLPPGDALEHLLGALDHPVPADPARRAAAFQEVLADRRILLLLDDAASAAQVAPLVPAAGRCLVLLTGRHRLTGIDRLVRLPLHTLPEDDAVALLTAGAGHPDAGGRAALGELARKCGLLPLALRAAVEHLAYGTPEAVTAELTDPLRQLGGVAAAFGSSFRALTGATRELFLLLGLHPGAPIEEGAAAAMAGVTTARARGLLADLADAGLLRAEPPGFTMHELVRRYAAGLAERHIPHRTRAAVVDQLVEYYLDEADTTVLVPAPRGASPGPGEPGACGNRLPALLALAALDSDVARPARSIALARAWARHAELGGDLDAAKALTLRALQTSRRTGDQRGEADALHDLGRFEARTGTLDDARTHLVDALVLRRDLGEVRGEAQTLSVLAEVARLLGPTRDAVDFCRRALNVHRHAGDREGEGYALRVLGEISLDRGKPAEAVVHLRTALGLVAETGNETQHGLILGALGRAHALLGHRPADVTHLNRALGLLSRPHHRVERGIVLTHLADVHRDAGRVSDALHCHQRALALAKITGEPLLEAGALNSFGETLYDAGDFDGARQVHESALQLGRRTGVRAVIARALNGLARAALAAGSPEKAHWLWRSALGECETLDSALTARIRACLSAGGAREVTR
ncbi:BTAD domain-containing putative transcriptional regulator [Amycolatopsis sp. WQ 127309]|uniref:AfsR/SARP family transcriptional regulator n=1 Tax=Amycolatopsis sp. WQ 127309 TaxID=2932773 RepID=UPI00211219FA|nr:BTAD domain-containing putative transcriptional regulator [Amycolatopsis sp. WQ 127309]